jgi:curved DNA-binding protein CbpA
VSEDPFLALGLPARAGLTDDDVRAAWRRIAAATPPDRDDGGDPVRFGAAAAGYALLRTAYGRGEALADLDSRARRDRRGSRALPGTGRGRPGRPAVGGPGRGRPGLLAVRILAAVAVGAAAVAAAGWTPATVGVVAGALTWLIATARHDLPRRPRE